MVPGIAPPGTLPLEIAVMIREEVLRISSKSRSKLKISVICCNRTGSPVAISREISIALRKPCFPLAWCVTKYPIEKMPPVAPTGRTCCLSTCQPLSTKPTRFSPGAFGASGGRAIFFLPPATFT